MTKKPIPKDDVEIPDIATGPSARIAGQKSFTRSNSLENHGDIQASANPKDTTETESKE